MIKIKNINENKLEKLKFIQPFLSLHINLAGGALTTLIDPTLEIADLDLFFVNLFGADKKNVKDNLETKIIREFKYEKSFQCKEDELRTFLNPDPENFPKIQFIDLKKKVYFSAEDIINEFDINAGRIAYDGEFIHLKFAALRDIMHKHISLNKVTYPISTINRIAKYSRKGYKTTIAAQDFVRLMQEPENIMETDVVYVD